MKGVWNLMLVLGGLALALAVAELLLRVLDVSHVVFMRPDAMTGWAHIPGAEGWWTSEGRSYVRINTHGWRDKERPVRKPAGVTRIAILGDSYMEAVQVPVDSAVPALLERYLNRPRPGRYEVLNFGVSGFGTAQELLVLRRYVMDYAPDAVILAFTTSNDVVNNSRTLTRSADSPFFQLVDGRLVLDTSFLQSPTHRIATSWRGRMSRFVSRYSRVVQLFRYARHSLRLAHTMALGEQQDTDRKLSIQSEIYLDPPPDTAWANAWNVTERLLALINTECRSQKIPFYVVTLSDWPQVTPDSSQLREFATGLGVADLLEPERRIERMGKREGFEVLALAPRMSARAIATHEYYHFGYGAVLGRGHWTAGGHRAAALFLGPWLADRLQRDLPQH